LNGYDYLNVSMIYLEFIGLFRIYLDLI